jgi:hypothetical protein
LVPEPNDKEGAMNILRDGQERWVDKEINNFIDNIWKDYSGELNKLIGYSNIDFLINSESDESSLCEYQKSSSKRTFESITRPKGKN